MQLGQGDSDKVYFEDKQDAGHCKVVESSMLEQSHIKAMRRSIERPRADGFESLYWYKALDGRFVEKYYDIPGQLNLQRAFPWYLNSVYGSDMLVGSLFSSVQQFSPYVDGRADSIIDYKQGRAAVLDAYDQPKVYDSTYYGHLDTVIDGKTKMLMESTSAFATYLAAQVLIDDEELMTKHIFTPLVAFDWGYYQMMEYVNGDNASDLQNNRILLFNSR